MRTHSPRHQTRNANSLWLTLLLAILQAACTEKTVAETADTRAKHDTKEANEYVIGDIGDCFLSEESIYAQADAKKVACEAEHTHQIYARKTLDAGAYPGHNALKGEAKEFCEQQMTSAVDIQVLSASGVKAAQQGLMLTSYQTSVPQQSNWETMGQRDMYCLYLHSTDQSGRIAERRTASVLKKPDTTAAMKSHTREVAYNTNMGCFADMAILSALFETAGDKPLALKFELEAENRMRAMIEGGTDRLTDEEKIMAEAEAHMQFVRKLEDLNERKAIEKTKYCAPHLVPELMAPAE
jgi:hypothetical protein